jgi:tetratricopeptide (TPR) repeat protein
MNPETGKRAQMDFDRAQQELDNNDILAALACLERALPIWDNPLWYSRLAFCIAKQRGHLTRAFELCGTALEHDPDNPLHYFYLGKVHLVAGDKQKALQAFRQGMAGGGSPELVQILAGLGTRKPPVIASLSRDNLLNKILGIVFARLGLR